MDFKQCFEILADRSKSPHDAACPCCTQTATQPSNGSQNNANGAARAESSAAVVSYHETEWAEMKRELVSDDDELSPSSPLELVQKVLSLQRLRIKVYQFFDKELETILIQGVVDQYPPLCARMTEYFSAISSSILAVKKEAQNRQMESFLKSIVNLQKLEKEKLLLVAAHHLDQMQPKIPALSAAMGGECPVQKTYLAGKIAEAEAAISEEVENLQAIKVDMLDMS